MRLWLRDSERKPDPQPVPTDDRRVVLIGLVLWVIALMLGLVLGGQLGADSVAGIAVYGGALGVIGLVYLLIRRH
jgi:hypothetical protein